METTLFNQPHEGNMDASEEIVPLSKIEDQNNESIMKIICKKAKCDEFRRHNKNIEEDDGAQLRKYMQEGDEIVAQIGVGNENDAESFMISGKKLTDDLFSHTHIESQMNPSYAKVIPLVNSDSPKMPTPAFSPDIVAQATKLDTPGLLSPSELIIENGNNKTLLSGEKVSLLQKVPNEADKNIFEEGVLRKLTSKTDDFSSSLGNNKSELDQNEGFRGVKGHHEPSKSLFEALKIIRSDPLLRVSQVEIAKSKLKLAKPIQVAVHQTEQNCDCQLFIKIIKTPGCMEFCKAKVLYEEQLRQLKNHSIGGTTEVDNKISTLLYDEASGDTITPDQLLAHKDLSNGSLPEQNLTTNTDQSNIKPLDTKMTAKNSEPNILTAFHNSSLARNNSNLSLNKKSGANSTMENLLTETNNALPLESKLKEQKATIGLNSKKKVDPKTSSRSFKLKSVKNTNEDQHDLDSLTEVLLKPTLLETNHHGTNHREKVILLSENKIPLISSSLSPLEIVDQAKRLQPDHIDADLSTDIVQELLKNSHPIKFPPSKKTHFNIHSLNKILHSSGPVIIENGDSNILEEDDDKSSPEIIKEINDEGGKEEDLVYDDDEDVDDHNDDQDDDDEKEYLSSVRARPLKGIDVSLMHTNYAEEHGSVKTIISNDESSNEEQNKEENDKLIGYKHHSFEDGSNFWLPEVIHHERNSSTQFQCVNGGVSVPVSKFDTQCMCPHQFYGKTCKDWNFCYPNPCSNGGQCQMISEIPKFKCHCKKAYIGHTCSEFNPCDPNPCNNNGVCSHDGKTATCTCTSRFKGENCAELSNCYPNPCKNNGRCVDMEGRFKCECQHGFIGKICEENDMCATNVCQNGGQCIVNGTSYSCQCTQGFVGRICQDRVCSPNPCHHGGICIQRENSMYACLCPSWAAGATCEDVSPCRMNPCKNGARCIDAMSGFRWTLKPMQYFCDCKPPFKGAHCEKNACSECHVDASCDADRCVCNFGFYGDGKTCNRKNHSEVIEVKPCQPNPCMNDGECFVKPGLLYECQCKAPFVPPNCAGKKSKI